MIRKTSAFYNQGKDKDFARGSFYESTRPSSKMERTAVAMMNVAANKKATGKTKRTYKTKYGVVEQARK